MRRTNRFSGALLIAVLLAAGLAPASSAEPSLSSAGWFGSLGQSVASWWAALTGDDGGERRLFAANEVAPIINPDGPQVAPHIDPNGAEVSESTDFDGPAVAPHIDPNG